jgi:hypothetical protein
MIRGAREPRASFHLGRGITDNGLVVAAWEMLDAMERLAACITLGADKGYQEEQRGKTAGLRQTKFRGRGRVDSTFRVVAALLNLLRIQRRLALAR